MNDQKMTSLKIQCMLWWQQQTIYMPIQQ